MLEYSWTFAPEEVDPPAISITLFEFSFEEMVYVYGYELLCDGRLDELPELELPELELPEPELLELEVETALNFCALDRFVL